MNEQETVLTDHEEMQNGIENPGEAEGSETSPKLVPVAEARRYRKRAQAAEKILEDVKAELAEKTERLEQQEAIVSKLHRERSIEERLVEAEAIDLEAARLLTEMSLAEMDEPDVEQAVSELRRRKPYLFQQRLRSGGAQSPSVENDESPRAGSLRHAAAEAGATGRRADVLRYLRLRRGGA